MKTKHQVLIIGSGCAGLTAAIYASRAQLSPVVIGGYKAGGQLSLTTEVENFPGFPEGVQGPELIQRMREQAAKFGTEFIDSDVTAVDFSGKPFKLTVDGTVHEADAVIIASGADARMLGVPSENRLLGHGVSTCATCDGFFYREKEIAVVGGGDSALEEATFLTRFASKVTVIHRRDEFRASKAMQQKTFGNPKVEIRWNAVVDDVLDEGTGAVTGIRLKDTVTGEMSELKVDGVFIAIGHVPNTAVFKGVLEMDEQGYLRKCCPGSMSTSIPGVFVAGDVYDTRYRQAITASGMGCQAALDAERWLEGDSHA